MTMPLLLWRWLWFVSSRLFVVIGEFDFNFRCWFGICFQVSFLVAVVHIVHELQSCSAIRLGCDCDCDCVEAPVRSVMREIFTIVCCDCWIEFCFRCCFLILIAHCCQDPFLVAVVHVLLMIRNVIMVFGLTSIAIAIVWKVLRASNCGLVIVEFCRTEFLLILFDYDTRSAILLHQLWHAINCIRQLCAAFLFYRLSAFMIFVLHWHGVLFWGTDFQL